MDGEPPQEEDFSQIPLVERSYHKVGISSLLDRSCTAKEPHRWLGVRRESEADVLDGQNWKARLSAYTDVISKAAKTASDTDPFFRPYVSDGQLLSVPDFSIFVLTELTERHWVWVMQTKVVFRCKCSGARKGDRSCTRNRSIQWRE